MQLSRAMDRVDAQVIDQLLVDGSGWMADRLSRVYSWLDDHLVDGVVNGSGWLTRRFGGLVRQLQNGFVQQYLLIIVVGFLFMVLFLDSLVSLGG